MPLTIAAVIAVAAAVSADDGEGADADAPSSEAPPDAERFATTIVLPQGFGSAEVERLDALGRPVTVRCSTCHAADATSDRREVRRASELEEVHVGLVFAHGELSCASCHDMDDRDKLRLADGQSIAFSEVLRLCSQCHGTVKRDYDKGAHGGMNGYWDTTRGPRTRNACVVCHDPHSPRPGKVMPAPPPEPANRP